LVRAFGHENDLGISTLDRESIREHHPHGVGVRHTMCDRVESRMNAPVFQPKFDQVFDVTQARSSYEDTIASRHTPDPSQRVVLRPPTDPDDHARSRRPASAVIHVVVEVRRIHVAVEVRHIRERAAMPDDAWMRS
jgi:hypothetical protein